MAGCLLESLYVHIHNLFIPAKISMAIFYVFVLHLQLIAPWSTKNADDIIAIGKAMI